MLITLLVTTLNIKAIDDILPIIPIFHFLFTIKCHKDIIYGSKFIKAIIIIIVKQIIYLL